MLPTSECAPSLMARGNRLQKGPESSTEQLAGTAQTQQHCKKLPHQAAARQACLLGPLCLPLAQNCLVPSPQPCRAAPCRDGDPVCCLEETNKTSKPLGCSSLPLCHARNVRESQSGPDCKGPQGPQASIPCSATHSHGMMSSTPRLGTISHNTKHKLLTCRSSSAQMRRPDKIRRVSNITLTSCCLLHSYYINMTF